MLERTDGKIGVGNRNEAINSEERQHVFAHVHVSEKRKTEVETLKIDDQQETGDPVALVASGQKRKRSRSGRRANKKQRSDR